MSRIALKLRSLELYYFFVRHVRELLTWLAAILLYFLAFKFVSDPKTLLLYSIVITTTASLSTIYLLTRQRLFYFAPFVYREKTDRWFGEGKFYFDPINLCYVITGAYRGYIYSETLLWSDYEMSFDFKIDNKCLGVIVRAPNISNYAMLQINLKGINPHLQINGGWSVFDAESSNLLFSSDLSVDKWYKAKIFCFKNDVTIIISDQDRKILFDRKWNLISGSAIFNFGDGKKPINVPFSANYEFGSIGFRNHSDERASIRNLLVKKI